MYPSLHSEIKSLLLQLREGEDASHLAELIQKFKRDNQRYRSRPVKKKRGRLAENMS